MQDNGNVPNWPDKRPLPPSTETPSTPPAPDAQQNLLVGPDTNPRSIAEKLWEQKQAEKQAQQAEIERKEDEDARVAEQNRRNRLAWWEEVVPWIAGGMILGGGIGIWLLVKSQSRRANPSHNK